MKRECVQDLPDHPEVLDHVLNHGLENTLGLAPLHFVDIRLDSFDLTDSCVAVGLFDAACNLDQN